MKDYREMSREELLALQKETQEKYEEAKAKGLKLDISRGKPSAEQLDLAEGMLTVIAKNEDCYSDAGEDCRNYGKPTGSTRQKN